MNLNQLLLLGQMLVKSQAQQNQQGQSRPGNQNQSQNPGTIGQQLLTGNIQDPKTRILKSVLDSALRSGGNRGSSNPWVGMALILGALIATEALMRNQGPGKSQPQPQTPQPPQPPQPPKPPIVVKPAFQGQNVTVSSSTTGTPADFATWTGPDPKKIKASLHGADVTFPSTGTPVDTTTWTGPKPGTSASSTTGIPSNFATWTGPAPAKITPMAMTQALQTPGPAKVGAGTIQAANALAGATPAQAASAPTKSLQTAAGNLKDPNLANFATATNLAVKTLGQGQKMA